MSRSFWVPATLKLWASAGASRGSCFSPRWASASMCCRRKTSSTRFLRMSVWWCCTSLGRSANGRRSKPTRCASPWSTRPSFPAMPVMATVRGRGRSGTGGRGGGEGGLMRSPEDVPPLLQPVGEQPGDGGADLGHLGLEHRVLVVRAAAEEQRLAEPDAVAGGQREGQHRGGDGEVREGE